MFNKKIYLFFIILISILFRLLISKIGYTYDLESYHIVGKLINAGKNIYAETDRYNYSPLWALTLGFIKNVSYVFDNNELFFRVFIIILLSFADVFIAFWLWRQYNFFFFIIFLFNPLSIYITGFHNQFDNLAIAFALWSAFFIEKKDIKKKLLGYLLLSLSICFKHLFIFILPWLFFRAKLRKEKYLVFLPVLIFLVLFLPFSFSNQGLKGIWENVFTYRNAYNIYSFFIFKGIWRPLILLFLISFAFLLIKKEKLTKQFALYLLLITAFSPIAAGQYLIIPIVGHLVINPLLGLFYITIASGFIFFKISNFLSFIIPVFQLSTLSLFINFYPIFFKKIKLIIISLVVAFSIIYSLNIYKELRGLYKQERKEILILRIFYPIKKIFDNDLLKKPLTKELILKGEFIAKEDNLGFLAIPFRLENPSGERFFKKNYQVGASISQTDNLKITYTEIRNINIGLTLDGIILGFPIQKESKGRKYNISLFSTIPHGDDFIMIDRFSHLQTKHFLTKDMVKNLKILPNFIWHKINYLLSLKNTWLLMFKIYFIIWVITGLVFYFQINKSLYEKFYSS